MTLILKDLTLGEFVVSGESPLYNTDTLAITADTSAVTILPGQPVTASGASATSPIGIAIEGITLEAEETGNVGILKKGYGVVLNRSILVERYPTFYPAAQAALEALGFVFKN
jgi:hypothetical protein